MAFLETLGRDGFGVVRRSKMDQVRDAMATIARQGQGIPFTQQGDGPEVDPMRANVITNMPSVAPPPTDNTSSGYRMKPGSDFEIEQTPASQTTLDQINAIDSKDYSRKKNPNYDPSQPESETNQKRLYGKDADRKRSFGDVWKSAGLGILKSLASMPPNGDLGYTLGRAIGGGAAGGIAGAVDPSTDEKMMDEFKLDQLTPKYQRQYGMEKQKADDDLRRENIRFDNDLKRDTLNANKEYRTATLAERGEQRQQAALNTKVRTVASMINHLPFIDTKDPRFANIVKTAGDLNLPITDKDSKKKVQLIQDAETGAWTVTLTDPLTGEQEVRPMVGRDGQPLATTSSSKVMANAASDRQKAGFDNQKQILALQNQYKEGFAQYQHQLDEIKAEKDATRRAQLQGLADQNKATLIALRSQLHQMEQDDQ